MPRRGDWSFHGQTVGRPELRRVLREAKRRAKAVGKTRDVDFILDAAGDILGEGPTEALWSDRSVTVPAALYVNRGDTYVPTILYDRLSDQFRIIAWGDYVEMKERRGVRFP